MKQDISKALKRNILLNPGPATTSAELKASLLVSDICPREKEFSNIISSIHSRLRRIVNATDKIMPILLPGSGTASVEAALLLLKRAAKGRVLVLKNGAYGTRIAQILATHHIPHDVLEFPNNQAIVTEQVIKELAKKEYAALCWVHVETTTGVLNPFESLLSICEEHELLSCCDGMSSVGCVAIDYQNRQCDLLITSSNKGLGGFAGVGIVYTSERILKLAQKSPAASFYLDLIRHGETQFAQRPEFAFTPPVQVLYGLNKALETLLEESLSSRYQQLESLQRLVVAKMLGLGFECYLDIKHHSPVITTFYYPQGFDFDRYHDYLYANNVTVYPGKLTDAATFRVANIGDIEARDIEYFISLTQEYLKMECSK